jgi:hypothetical protein
MMDSSAAVRRGTQAEFHTQQCQAAGGEGWPIGRAVVILAASLLMLASAGFGCQFAYTQGVHHGPALAGFAVAMAVGLELAKPFAIEATFACFRRWALARGLAMALLGFVAVAYSLTAETGAASKASPSQPLTPRRGR